MFWNNLATIYLNQLFLKGYDMEILGIDIGGSGIKGAIVDVNTGEFTQDRHRIPTPDPSTPEAVADVVLELANYFKWKGPVGCTFPAIIKNGVMLSAANVDDAWMGTNGQQLFASKLNAPIRVVNDADAAGIAEMRFGAGIGHENEVVIMLTLGTGIGSAIFVNGHLLPNTELGHLELRGKIAEERASDRARTRDELSWKKWGKRLTEYIGYLEFLFSPDLIIIGGGVSKKHEKFFDRIEVQTPIVPAHLLNHAGIIGAALAAKDLT